MLLGGPFEKFVGASPDSVMMRGIIEKLFHPERLERLFEKTAADALKVADLYGKRWSVETMFQEMTENLTCEIKTLGYPRAAVFAFCLALIAWNGMSVIHAALRNVHGEESVGLLPGTRNRSGLQRHDDCHLA